MCDQDCNEKKIFNILYEFGKYHINQINFLDYLIN